MPHFFGKEHSTLGRLCRVFISSVIVFVAFAALVSYGYAGEREERGKRAAVVDETDDGVFLQQALRRIELRTFGKEDFQRTEKLYRKGDDARKQRSALILSRYHRLLAGEKLAAAEPLLAVLLDKETASVWLKENAAAQKESLAKWKLACAEAKAEKTDIPSKPESEVFIPVPTIADEIVTINNSSLLLELVRCYLSLGLTEDALRLVNAVGEKVAGLSRALSGECAGEVMVATGRFGEAVGVYQFALKVLRSLRSSGAEEDPEHKAVRLRIEAALAEAKRLWDIERYGAGFAKYKIARTLQLEKKDYLSAALVYGEIQQEFSKTVYAEASFAYEIQNLLALSFKENQAKAKTAIEKQAAEIKAVKDLLTAAKNNNAPKFALAELEKILSEKTARLNSLKSVPLGKSAETTAYRLGEVFAKAREFGLYRGEVLTNLAQHGMETQLDPGKAQSLFQRAWLWTERVAAVDEQLSAFDVPDKAKEVTAPPEEEAKVDNFGNVDAAKITPEMIVNRRTCKWWLSDIKEKCALSLGFLAFVEGKNDEALEWYKKVPELDLATNLLCRKDEWNDYTRLKWGAEHGYLNAFPQELKLYEKRLKFIVLLADFHFCTRRFGKTVELCERMLSNEFGRLSFEQDDYPQYLIALCQNWDQEKHDRKAAFLACKKLLENQKKPTLTQSRAAFTAANLSWYVADEEIMREGLELMKKVAGSSVKDNPYASRARLVLGLRLLQLGYEQDGVKWLAKVPEKADGYYGIAQKYLASYANYQQFIKEQAQEQKAEN
jgi:hypothetical protein